MAGLALSVGCTARADFKGTELSRPIPASAFNLSDQFGQRVTLADLKGRVVVLAFLYTNCPDVCPLVTETLSRAYDVLGKDTEKTAFVAITVDPARDTIEQVYRYSEHKGMLHKWAFLTGSQEELEPVWQAYYVAVEPEVSPGNQSAQEQLIQETISHPVAGGADSPTAGYDVGHSAPLYLIDRQGELRVAFTQLSLDPSPLVHDIRLLLR